MHTTIILRVVVGLATMVLAGMTHAADDAYLKALQAEAQTVSGKPGEEKAEPAAPANVTKKGWALSDQIIGGELPKELSQQDFEATLENSFYGTFMFYSKLNTADKVDVYQEYQRKGTIENIRNKVMSLLKK